MRVAYVSDLHLEFHRDAGGAFVASLNPAIADVLVVAGDLAVADGIGPALDSICSRYWPRPVVYVHGNHELYGTTRERTIAITEEAAARHRNLRWLDCSVTEIDGRRFVGAPLWFGRHPDGALLNAAMNDFREIQGLEEWVYEENARAREFFARELRNGDIAVSHHLPSQASVAPRWRGSPLNPFFVSDVEDTIRARQPALWIHGHTHDSVDTMVGSTRVLCNPFGYVRVEENRAFDENAVAVVTS